MEQPSWRCEQGRVGGEGANLSNFGNESIRLDAKETTRYHHAFVNKVISQGSTTNWKFSYRYTYILELIIN